MRLEFNAEGHLYRLDGSPVPSVTQVLSLLEDFSCVSACVLEAARVFGQHVHTACALEIRGRLDWERLDSNLVPYVEAWRRFVSDSGVVIVASNLRVGHPELGFAGELDADVVLHSDGGTLDIKSGALPRTVGPQTAAYEVARARTLNVKFRRRKRWALQLDPGFALGYKLHELKKETDWTVFQSALNCWRFLSEA